MCGRFKRGSDKQRVAEVFHVGAGLDETVFDEGDDLRPQSFQPVIYMNDDGVRQIESMRWAFNLPDRLVFNARSEGIERSRFWKDAFLTGRCILPGDAIYEWQEAEKGKKKTKVRIHDPRPASLWNGCCLEGLEESQNRSMGKDIRRADR